MIPEATIVERLPRYETSMVCGRLGGFNHIKTQSFPDLVEKTLKIEDLNHETAHPDKPQPKGEKPNHGTGRGKEEFKPRMKHG